MHRYCILIFQLIVISFCICEFTENKDKFINVFVNHLNSLADHPFFYEEAELLKEQQINNNEYCIEIKVKASDKTDAYSKFQNCTGNIFADGDGQLSVGGVLCSDLPESWTENLEELVTDLTTNDGPIQLENEVQTENISTSGEQFIAVPRNWPAPCIGCASYVDTNAAGVKEMASLGIQQIDHHEPAVQHSLNEVLLVERQVQVVGGVRYIFTLTVGYNNCSEDERDNCNYEKICRISILEKPWHKLPDGSKFRAVLSNNCTEDWLFNENETLMPNFSNQTAVEKNDYSGVSTPHYNQTILSNEDGVIAIHNKEVQVQPTGEKTLTDKEMKDLEDQILIITNKPSNKVNQPTDNNYYAVSNSDKDAHLTEETVVNLDAAKLPDIVTSTEHTLSNDKKKAIDEFMNFFDFTGSEDKTDNIDLMRMKRDYSSDLQFLNLAEKYQNMKTKIKNAQFIHKLAQAMINYLNDRDIEVKTRQLKEVISAEEEVELDRRYFYLQVSVVIPCETQCKTKEVKICSGIIDGTEYQPTILYTVCNSEQKKPLGHVKQLRQDDPILLKFLKQSMKKIDVESNLPYALKIKKILSASTQKVSGRLTKVSVEIEYTECLKTVPIFRRNNCTVLENLGSKLCDIQIFERHWLKDTKITYDCTERPVDEVFVADLNNQPSTDSKRLTINDPRVLQIIQEALQYLEVRSNRNNKQKLVEVKSVSSRQVAGLLTSVVFTTGYTECTSDFKNDVNTCKLLENEPLQNCLAEVWERQWLDDKRQFNVTCEKFTSNSEKENQTYRQKRGALVGGPTTKDVEDPKYKKLAEESVQQYCKESGITKLYEIVKIDKVTVQVVAGSLTKIDFHVSPTNCQVDSNGQSTSSNCVVQAGSKTFECHSEIWERPWLDKDLRKIIEVNCTFDITETRKKRSIKTTGFEWAQNPSDYKQLAEDCLTNYMFTYGTKQHYKMLQLRKAVKVNTTGDLTKLDFLAAPTNCKVKNGYPTSSPCEIKNVKNTLSCHAEVWTKPELNSRVMNVYCQKDNEILRKKRQVVVGGQVLQNNDDPKFSALAAKSLTKYVLKSRLSQYHKVITIEKVHRQIVSGVKTLIDFTASPTDCQIDRRGKPMSSSCEITNSSDILHCSAEILEQPWLGKEAIDVGCHSNKPRSKRTILLGEAKGQNVSDLQYLKLAEDSLEKYVSTSGSAKKYNIIQVLKVNTKVVSGKLTNIEFEVQGPSGMLYCNSEVLEQPWKNRRDIDVSCTPSKSRRRRREVRSFSEGRSLKTKIEGMGGSFREEEPTGPKYIKFVDKALKKYVKKKKIDMLHKIVEIKSVFSKVVSGKIYKIDFISAPTTCSLNVSKGASCDIVESSILNCHTEVWDRPWLRRTEITVVFCNNATNDEEGEYHEVRRNKRSFTYERRPYENETGIKYLKFGRSKSNTLNIMNKRSTYSPTAFKDTNGFDYMQKSKFYNSERFKQLAEESLREFESISKSEIVYKVVKVHYINEDDNNGIRIQLDFSASPSNCSTGNHNRKNNCQFLEPKSFINCHANVRFTLMLNSDLVKSIEVKCLERKNKHASEYLNKNRHKRQLPIDENVEEDLMYNYADRVMASINEQLNGKNIYKLITVHDIRRTLHMKSPLVRMYLEVAKSYCLKDEIVDELSYCNELEGMSHLLCFARIYPARYDDLIVQDVQTVCEDDHRKFYSLTGFVSSMFLHVSLSVLNRHEPNKKLLISYGETHVIPTLDYNKPFRLTFIAVETNCTRDHAKNNSERNADDCFPVLSVMPRRCMSRIYMTSNTRTISFANVTCLRMPGKRNKRSISLKSENITNEDIVIQKLVQEALYQLETVSANRYKQRVLVINRFSTKTTTDKQTTIDFDVGYTNCLKFEWVDNITDCEFLEHLPRRHCVAVVQEDIIVETKRNIEVSCDDDETPLEANMEPETAQSAVTLSNEVLKRIEYKYPHPRRQIVVRIFSLEKQEIAGLHYRLKMEIGYTNCMALSLKDHCKLDPEISARKFCRANVWLRSWTNHPPSYRVTCDYQDNGSNELYYELQAEQLFADFITTYRPSYMDDYTELQKRYTIFKNNVKKIHELNVYEMGTARYAVTKYSDLSPEEFSKSYLGLNPKLRDENQVPMPDAVIPSVEIPDSFDWREHGAVTEVKNQGSCGSCWAFSVTGNIEGQWKRHSGKLVSLSEQELVDCDKLDEGCNGGLPDNAYRAIEQLGGLEMESDYPYEGEDDKCAYNATLSRVQISGAVNISSNETDMAKWLVKNGPISIGINANAMQFYVGGVSHPWRMLCNPSNLDHGVLVVGYGEKDYPLFHKKLPYWIVKNSWGKFWGEQGYYRVYRGDGTCGVNQMASSAVV